VDLVHGAYAAKWTREPPRASLGMPPGFSSRGHAVQTPSQAATPPAQLSSAATSPAGHATTGFALPQASLPSLLRLLAYKDPQLGPRTRTHHLCHFAPSVIAGEASLHADDPPSPLHCPGRALSRLPRPPGGLPGPAAPARACRSSPELAEPPRHLCSVVDPPPPTTAGPALTTPRFAGEP
jgi:hypothetical protein